MDFTEKHAKIFFALIAFALGSYAGYWFTNDHYVDLEASKNKQDDTAVCRLELREGNKGDVKEKYIAILEYRTEDGGKEFCENYTPTDRLPESTKGMSLNSLYSEQDYEAQVPSQEY